MATLNPNNTGYTAAASAPGTSIQWGAAMFTGTHIGIAKFTTALSNDYTSFDDCWIKSATIKVSATAELANTTVTIGVTNTAPPSPSANPPATPSCYRSANFTCNKTGVSTIDITSLFRRGGNATYLKPNNSTWYIVFKQNGNANLSGTRGFKGKDDYTSVFTYTIAAKPSVSAGSKITETQITTLATYLEDQTGATFDMSNNVAGKQIKHDYTTGLASNTAGNKINASWYNGA